MKKILIILTILFPIYSVVYAAPIYTYKEEIPISDSITLTKVEEFYSGHNLSYSYIKADLSDEYTSLKLLTSDKGVDVMDTVTNLAATGDNTVAAMNADFFSRFSGNQGFALGMEIKDGELLQSPINPDTMATIAYIDESVLMSYLDFHIMAVAPNWQYNEIRHLNKHTSYYGDILMYTKEFNNGMSPAPGGEVLEVVVSDGKITEFRRNMPPVQIPEDGCVLVVSEGANMFFANNFNVGDEIRFDYYITPDISEAQVAFGGGAMLVSEGQLVTNFSHVVSGYNPRSAIGVDESGKTLYLVAVNGRQDGSRGMTMSELAALMKSLGCYNAVNLDGGGSTNMVASTVWNENIHTVNSPTENRKVINAVGLSYSQEKKEPYGIALKSEKNAVFIGQPVKITAAVYDENLRPVSGEVSWSSEFGKVENGVFTPSAAGMAVVEARSGNAYGKTEIFVVDTVSGIDVDSHIRMGQKDTYELDIHVFDDAGHYVEVTNVESFEISSSDPSVVSVSGKMLRAKSEGTAVIAVKKDGVASYATVVVGSGAKQYTDNFETLSGSFKSYPTYVTGDFSLSGDRAYSGKTSGKLSYDFTAETDEAKGAYFVLDKGMRLADSCDELSVYFYAENEFGHELRAQFTDGDGQMFITSFGREYKKGTWQKLIAEIPESAVRPLTLDRVYALYVAGEERDSGDIYIDDLSFELSAPLKFESAPANVYKKTESGYSTGGRFVVGAMLKNSQTLLSNLVNNRVSKYVSSFESGALIGNIGGFKSYEDKNALYINLDTSKGGIRNTNSAQWDDMVKAIELTGRKNVFILSDNSVFGGNEFENKVLHDYLASAGKNVFVITGGNRNAYKNIDGVKYFTLGSDEGEVLSETRVKNYSSLEFGFGGEVSFEWKSLY